MPICGDPEFPSGAKITLRNNTFYIEFRNKYPHRQIDDNILRSESYPSIAEIISNFKTNAVNIPKLNLISKQTHFTLNLYRAKFPVRFQK